MQHGIARDAGIVDQDVDRAESLGDLGHALGTGVEVTYVPFVDRNAGLDLELLRGGIVAGVVRSDTVALVLECCGNGVANATRATSNNGNARHECSSSLESRF